MRVYSSIDKFVFFLKGESIKEDFLSSDFKGLRTKDKTIFDSGALVISYYKRILKDISNIHYENEDSHILLYYDLDNLTHIVKVRFDELGLINSLVEEIYLKDYHTMVLVVSYDGSLFYGAQKQSSTKGLSTIQETIEKALTTMTGFDIPIIMSSRTDRGVHALGQVVSFDSHSISPDKYKYALNNILPPSIRVKDAYLRSQLFNARYDVIKKTYQYIVDMGEYDLFKRNYCFFFKVRNISKIRDELKCLVGTHDFSAFSKGHKENSIRTMYDASVHLSDNRLIFTFTSSGFLHNMIRLIVGSVLEIDRKGVGSLKAILDSKDNNQTPHLAPPEGLYLMSITY